MSAYASDLELAQRQTDAQLYVNRKWIEMQRITSKNVQECLHAGRHPLECKGLQ